jgi:hypothetical protein
MMSITLSAASFSERHIEAIGWPLVVKRRLRQSQHNLDSFENLTSS